MTGFMPGVTEEQIKGCDELPTAEAGRRVALPLGLTLEV
jgi:hypothetical protein